MKTSCHFTKSLLLIGVFGLFFNLSLNAQPEVQAWGNLRGIRIDGQLMRFESSLRVVGDDWTHERATAKERNWTRYRREGKAQIVRTRMDSLFFTEKVLDAGLGEATVEVEFDPHEDRLFTGAFFHLLLPAIQYANAKISPVEIVELDLGEQPQTPVGPHERLRIQAMGIQVETDHRELGIRVDRPVEILVAEDPISGDIGIYFTLQSGKAVTGNKVSRTFDIEVSGTPDTETANLTFYPDYPGNAFLGMGGNFRLQNPRHDPQVIDYCLENMDVRMGRVQMPWRWWHTEEGVNPLEEARKGNLHPRVKAAMEMAQRLHKMGMPVLGAVWFPPAWAAKGEIRSGVHPDGTRGNPLREDKKEAIYASLTGYMLFLKEAYGVEIEMFSFNESDLGIDVRQTAAEHVDLIKGLGAYMRSKGLKTKLLLGDTADANGFDFVNDALDDPETWQYIGAVSFHSWRGWKKETLLEWYEAADRLNIPLIVGEGSIDAAAWRYPGIFEEPHYAMEEIKLYVRMLAICQPQTILQWQLTSDYSPLAGGGIFGDDSTPLRPTQRFWNLKQLGHTPAGLFAMPLTCDNNEMFVTALGDVDKGSYAFHLVNDGPEREVVLSGLPKNLKRLRIYTTDRTLGMEKGDRVRVKGGVAKFRVSAAGFTSLFSD